MPLFGKKHKKVPSPPNYPARVRQQLECVQLVNFTATHRDNKLFRKAVKANPWFAPMLGPVNELKDDDLVVMQSEPQLVSQAPIPDYQLVDPRITEQLIIHSQSTVVNVIGDVMENLGCAPQFSSIRTVKWSQDKPILRSEVASIAEHVFETIICPAIETLTEIKVVVERVHGGEFLLVKARCPGTTSTSKAEPLLFVSCESPNSAVTYGQFAHADMLTSIEYQAHEAGCNDQDVLKKRARFAQHNAAYAMEKACKFGIRHKCYLHALFDGTGLTVSEMLEAPSATQENDLVLRGVGDDKNLWYRGIGLEDKLVGVAPANEWSQQSVDNLPQVMYKRTWQCVNESSEGGLWQLLCLLVNEITKRRNNFNKNRMMQSPARRIIATCQIPGYSRGVDTASEENKRGKRVFYILDNFLSASSAPVSFSLTKPWSINLLTVRKMSEFIFLKVLQNQRVGRAGVYLIAHPTQNTVAVLKVRPEGHQELFFEELVAYNKLCTPGGAMHVPRVLESGKIQNRASASNKWYVVMEYVPGINADFGDITHIRAANSAVHWMAECGLHYDFDACFERSCKITHDGRCVVLGRLSQSTLAAEDHAKVYRSEITPSPSTSSLFSSQSSQDTEPTVSFEDFDFLK